MFIIIRIQNGIHSEDLVRPVPYALIMLDSITVNFVTAAFFEKNIWNFGYSKCTEALKPQMSLKTALQFVLKSINFCWWIKGVQ